MVGGWDEVGKRKGRSGNRGGGVHTKDSLSFSLSLCLSSQGGILKEICSRFRASEDKEEEGEGEENEEKKTAASLFLSPAPVLRLHLLFSQV